MTAIRFHPGGMTAVSRWLSAATPPANRCDPSRVEFPHSLTALSHPGEPNSAPSLDSVRRIPQLNFKSSITHSPPRNHASVGEGSVAHSTVSLRRQPIEPLTLAIVFSFCYHPLSHDQRFPSFLIPTAGRDAAIILSSKGKVLCIVTSCAGSA